jgi:hypothetical protein
MSHPEFELKKRVKALRAIGLTVIDLNDGTVDIKHHNCDALGSAHREAATFICDPVYTPLMWNMEPNICNVVNRLHYQFWCWRNKDFYIDIEEEITKSLKKYLSSGQCREQDKWLEYKPDDIKKIIMDNCFDIFLDDDSPRPQPGSSIISNLVYEIMHNDKLSWTRIHSQLFK